MSLLLGLPDREASGRLGAALARRCPWGQQACCIFLRGPLGAGKTTLAAALIATLGAGEQVRSPSYSLIETYPLPPGLAVHLDLYRLEDPAELEMLGLRDYLNPRTLLIVEWPEHGGDRLPRADLMVTLQVLPAGRRCHIETSTATAAAWLTAAALDVQDLVQS